MIWLTKRVSIDHTIPFCCFESQVDAIEFNFSSFLSYFDESEHNAIHCHFCAIPSSLPTGGCEVVLAYNKWRFLFVTIYDAHELNRLLVKKLRQPNVSNASRVFGQDVNLWVHQWAVGNFVVDGLKIQVFDY